MATDDAKVDQEPEWHLGPDEDWAKKDPLDDWKQAEERVTKTGMEDWEAAEARAAEARDAEMGKSGPAVFPPAPEGTAEKVITDGGVHKLPTQTNRAKSNQPSTCKAIRDDATDEYCIILCATADCPLDLCQCADTLPTQEVKEAARSYDSDNWKNPWTASDSAGASVSETPGQGWSQVASSPVPLKEVSPHASDGTHVIRDSKASCVSKLESSSSSTALKYENDLWCATTCGNGMCPESLCDCGPDMEYVKDEDMKAAWKPPAARGAKPQQQMTHHKTQHGPKWIAKHDTEAAGTSKRKVSPKEEKEDEAELFARLSPGEKAAAAFRAKKAKHAQHLQHVRFPFELVAVAPNQHSDFEG